MSNYDRRYHRTDRHGVEQAKLVVWLPIEDKEKLRKIADRRRAPMGDVANDAIAAMIAEDEATILDCE